MLSAKRAKSEKKQSLVSGPPATSEGRSVLHPSPPVKEADIIKEAAASKKVENKTRGTAVVDAGHAESHEPLVTCASSQSLLDLLADQALSRAQPLPVSQELLAAAVSKYKNSLQRCSFAVDAKSPPLPPPPPQSSPVDFPLTRVCHLLQMGEFARHVGAGQMTSDNADITIQ